MKLIAAVDKNWAIGNKGQLLVSIPQDQKMFRNETMGKVIVMGRKTLEGMPGAQPLYGRTNIVLSADPDYKVKGATVCGSVEEVMELLKAYHTDDVYIIGGESVYRQFLPYCDTIHLTAIDYVYDADLRFPVDLDQAPDWKLAEEGEEQTYFDLCYTFCRYVRTGM